MFSGVAVEGSSFLEGFAGAVDLLFPQELLRFLLESKSLFVDFFYVHEKMSGTQHFGSFDFLVEFFGQDLELFA